MNGKSCFFIGHREAPDTVLPLLQETVNRHIECYGVTEFIVGHYGNFDYLAAKAVIGIGWASVLRPAWISRAARSWGGKGFPRSDARRIIPRQAFLVK